MKEELKAHTFSHPQSDNDAARLAVWTNALQAVENDSGIVISVSTYSANGEAKHTIVYKKQALT